MPSSTPSLFPASPSQDPAETITAHCDGGARGNPGPAGFGAQITDAHGNILAELSEFLGFRTNNYAEYSGLLASLQFALDHGHRSLKVISDSELMVKQIQGRYKVNSPDLKPLWQEARTRIARLDRFEIAHALRHKNKAADRLANEAMDRGMNRGPDPNARGMNRTPDPNARGVDPSPSPGHGPKPGTPGQPALLGHPEQSEGPAALPRTPIPEPRRSGVQSLPLRAIPYPDRSAAPPAPGILDPAPKGPTPRAERSDIGRPAPSQPAMLRGFARDGVIHILGAHTLPNGTFVKIIPE